jgi:ABC-type glycerol-3-phosphate transport system substrate-binding protein
MVMNRNGVIRLIQEMWFTVVLLLVTWSAAFAADAPKWQAEWQKTIEVAKKEGHLSLYGGQEITHPDIVAAFNKEFPFIKVTTTSGRGGDLVARIVAERRADKYLADVMASGPNGPRMLYLGKALDPVAPAFILPEVTGHVKVVRRKALVRGP